jgi:TfoX/Sxy family transcriptional regulator of competence genes
MNRKRKASNFCFRKIEFWTQIKVRSMHENCGLFCNQTICWCC